MSNFIRRYRSKNLFKKKNYCPKLGEDLGPIIGQVMIMSSIVCLHLFLSK